MKVPALLPTLAITDNAQLAAHISCAFARQGSYLPIIDGPRLSRPDRDAEVVRRNNAAGRAKPDTILLADLSTDARDAIMRRFTPRLRSKIKLLATASDLDGFGLEAAPRSSPLAWGRDRIGIGLLKALYAHTGIAFSDNASPAEHVPPKSDHLVVCEEGDEFAQVVAANYAFALRAGLCLIPETDDVTTEQILEDFYSLYDRGISPADALTQLRTALRERCGTIPIPPSGSLTFVANMLPYGFAFPEAPSTHLFKYPDLGIAVINGFAAEQPNTRGTAVAMLVSPDEVDAPEIDAAEKVLFERRALVRPYRGPAANVRAVAEMIEFFPYHLLIIATHCGDASGYRWTYEFTDSEGINRKLVVDLAIGVAGTDDEDMLNVTQFMRFVSLDVVDWHDPEQKDKLYVGRAILDFMERTRTGARDELTPVAKEDIPRVTGSAVLKMYDQHYISLPHAIAAGGMPIIVNNACSSWHRLASNYTFGNARAYIGTLFPVTTSEAHGVVERLLGKHFGKPLPTALWSAQREVYGANPRHPYVMSGVYPQRLRIPHYDVPAYIESRLLPALNEWREGLKAADPNDQRLLRKIREAINYYERETAHFQSRRQKLVKRIGT